MNTLNLLRAFFSGFVVVFLATGFAQAAPFTLDETIQPLHLKPHKVKQFPGVLTAAAEGTLEDKPQYLFADGMSAREMQAIMLFATGKEKVRVNVVKNLWDEKLKTCEARTDQPCNINFKSFGDAGFKITGKTGARYLLVLMRGPEESYKTLMPSPIYPANKEELTQLTNTRGKQGATKSDDSSGGTSFQKIVIALLVVLILLVLIGIFVLKRKPGRLSILLLFILVGTISTPLKVEAQRITDLTKLASGLSNISEMGKDLEYMEKVYKALKAGRGMANVILSNCDRMGNPPGTPRIPSFCSGNKACSQCYSGARDSFNDRRATLEKLRLIYKCTTDFTKKAISFGDDVSPATGGLGGLAWQTQRSEIEKSIKGLENAVDQKYVELMGGLHESMMQMDACEAQFGLPDWYDRFGFTYFDFMAEKYARPGGTTVHGNQFPGPESYSNSSQNATPAPDTQPEAAEATSGDASADSKDGKEGGASSDDKYGKDGEPVVDDKYGKDGEPVADDKYGKDDKPVTDDKYGKDDKPVTDDKDGKESAKPDIDEPPIKAGDQPVIGEPDKPSPIPDDVTKDRKPKPDHGG